jgi:hypothetical protein
MPHSTRFRSSEDETVLMTAYSVSFSRRARSNASAPVVDGSVNWSIVTRAGDRPYVQNLRTNWSNDVSFAHCTNVYSADTVAMIVGSDRSPGRIVA